jgi:hypothetical protein
VWSGISEKETKTKLQLTLPIFFGISRNKNLLIKIKTIFKTEMLLERKFCHFEVESPKLKSTVPEATEVSPE